VKKCLLRPPADESIAAGRFIKLLYHFLSSENRVALLSSLIDEPLEIAQPNDLSIPKSLTTIELYRLSEELLCKGMNLSPKLQREYYSLRLCIRREFQTGKLKLMFPSDFLGRVSEYMKSVKRPVVSIADGGENLRQDPEEKDFSLLSSGGGTKIPGLTEVLPRLSALPRELCPECNSFRSIYCGPCLGLRMPSAELELPARINLPFDIILILHPAESLRHCTGIHAAVMGQREHVTVLNWPRTRDRCANEESAESWVRLLDTLNHETDVLLFPDPYAISVASWTDEIGTENLTERRRVVVLEASWNNSKAMFRQLQDGLVARGRPPLRAVKLQDIVGTYWKFHYEGNAAVSTIEAIVHLLLETSSANSLSEDISESDRKQYLNLLWLFECQRLRLINRVEAGGKVPRAIEVKGTGIGSWKPFLGGEP